MKSIIKLITILCFTLPLKAQNVHPQLDTLLRKTLDSMRNKLGNKSFSASIQFNDTSNWNYATGISEENPDVLVTPQHLYQVSFITKTITAASIMKLAENGVLTLEDSLHKWIPAVKNVDSNITIRQLLRHQSGLEELFKNPNAEATLFNSMNQIWTTKALLDSFLLPPVATPGGNALYATTNYLLLGMIIKAATGKEYYQFIRDSFLTPLQLNSFKSPVFDTLSSPIAHVWQDLDNDNFVDDFHSIYYYWLSLNAAMGSAGCYYATAKDVSKWMRTYGRGDLHTASSMQQVKTTIAAPGLPATTYGLGIMRRNINGIEAFGHGGDFSYSASSWYFPSKDISISVLNNDRTKISWDLISTVAALLRTYNTWSSTLSINSITNKTEPVLIYPVPFANQITIVFPKSIKKTPYHIQLFTTSGQLVYDETCKLPPANTIIIEKLEKIEKGSYVLSIKNDEGFHFQKIISK